MFPLFQGNLAITSPSGEASIDCGTVRILPSGLTFCTNISYLFIPPLVASVELIFNLDFQIHGTICFAYFSYYSLASNYFVFSIFSSE